MLYQDNHSRNCRVFTLHRDDKVLTFFQEKTDVISSYINAKFFCRYFQRVRICISITRLSTKRQ